MTPTDWMTRKKDLTVLKTSFIIFALWVTPISISGLIEMQKKLDSLKNKFYNICIVGNTHLNQRID
jgi:hypothetical protein